MEIFLFIGRRNISTPTDLYICFQFFVKIFEWTFPIQFHKVKHLSNVTLQFMRFMLSLLWPNYECMDSEPTTLPFIQKQRSLNELKRLRNEAHWRTIDESQ